MEEEKTTKPQTTAQSTPGPFNRRTLLKAIPGAFWLGGQAHGANSQPIPTRQTNRKPRALPMTHLRKQDLLRAEHPVTSAQPNRAVNGVHLIQEWKGDLCKNRLTNRGTEPVQIAEVTLFTIPHALPDTTELYAEGSQMLSQTGGTLGKQIALGGYGDHSHYKLPQPEGATTVYNLLLLTPPAANPTEARHSHLLAFTSAHRFTGKFHLYPDRIEIVQETEGLTLGPGASWELEEFLFATHTSTETGTSHDILLTTLADHLNRNHPPLIGAHSWQTPPSGWCSWYCFGAGVTSKQVLDNLDIIAKQAPELKYVQIDDGYQPAMGDWLETGKAFGGDVRGVLKQIKDRGFEPAIWVAPFIADGESHIFKTHPDWFMQDADGHPLPANRVTFGGWRRGPWYALDGTHPEVEKHLEQVFRTMRNEWGCTYFKMDANFWGMMPGGKLHDPKATRVEAYRRGMAAIRRGAGDSFLLGCNHPLWPSLGEIHGSRSSNDISRSWNSFKHTARENLSRTWQNGRLWWIDPDCVLLTGKLSDDEFLFHTTVLFATGGMVLSGDDLTKLPAERIATLRRMLAQQPVVSGVKGPLTEKATQNPANHIAKHSKSGYPGTRFTDTSFRIGQRGDYYFLLNWEDQSSDFHLKLPADSHGQLRDFWTDMPIKEIEQIEPKGEIHLNLPARSARLFYILKSKI